MGRLCMHVTLVDTAGYRGPTERRGEYMAQVIRRKYYLSTVRDHRHRVASGCSSYYGSFVLAA